MEFGIEMRDVFLLLNVSIGFEHVSNIICIELQWAR